MLGPLDPHRPVLPSQRHSPSPHQSMSEYGHDNSANSYHDNTSNVRGQYDSVTGNVREPLQESTGNAQHQYPHGQRPLPSLSSTVSCSPGLSNTLSSSSLGPLAPIPAPIPPILPTQSLHGGSAAAAAGSSALILRRHHLSVQRQSRHSLKNPIYLSNEFCQYRMKQKDKEKQVWPDVLEDAFLDGESEPISALHSSDSGLLADKPIRQRTALLLIVHMGRRKYFLHQKQHGRNMLICEYIWIAYKQSLPPGSNNPTPYTYEKAKTCECKPPRPRHKPEEDCWVKVKHPMYRERKQVSSHIQVIKNFFRFHPACELKPCTMSPCAPSTRQHCKPRRTRGVRTRVNCSAATRWDSDVGYCDVGLECFCTTFVHKS